MKTILLTTLTAVTALSLVSAEDKTLGEKTTDALEKAKDKTEEAGRAIANTTKKAADKVIDAVTPDADARRIEVRLNEHSIDMPLALETGKTAFVVRNSSGEKRNFEIKGEGMDKKFLAELGPEETKVLHVDLKAGSYKASDPMKDRETGSSRLTLIVK